MIEEFNLNDFAVSKDIKQPDVQYISPIHQEKQPRLTSVVFFSNRFRPLRETTWTLYVGDSLLYCYSISIDPSNTWMF